MGTPPSLYSRRYLVALSAFLLAITCGVAAFVFTVYFVFGIQTCDLLSRAEVEYYTQHRSRPYNTASVDGDRSVELIPRIIHQTWKTGVLPDRWKSISDDCRAMHPDFEYKLWTDASSRSFVEEHYKWFLDTYDGYEYAIQRADAIRYFVLHHYGGVYLDLDVGCQKPIDPLLNFEVVLPETRPIGISNDIIMAAPRHPFMLEAIESLPDFDTTWLSTYPRVMFSTGPMFLSAIYGSWPARDVNTRHGVRVLSRIMYGKYAAQHTEAFFKHYFASSWHQSDAWPIVLLGDYGVYIVYVIVILGLSALARHAYIAHPWRYRRSPLLDEEGQVLLHDCDSLMSPLREKIHSPLPVPLPLFATSWRPSSAPLISSAASDMTALVTEKQD